MIPRSARAPWRRLAVAGVAVAWLLATALPASAAPSTKQYTAAVSTAGSVPASSVTVPAGGTVVLTLTDAVTSNQSFASARVVFGGVLPTDVSVAASGWQLTRPASGTWQVTSTGPSVAPGGSLALTLTMPADGDGRTSVSTTVKQSNDFNGQNNQFTILGSDPAIVTVPAGTGTYCAGVCSPTIQPSTTGTTATLTMTSSASFRYTAAFGTGTRLSCQDVPFGPGVTADPLLVQASGGAGIAKTISLTFPKSLVNLVPDNGTPNLAICSGADAAFPGSSATTAGSYPYEGLVLDCTDPAYQSAIAGSGFPLHLCVAARSKKAGSETVVLTIDSSTADPSFW